MLIDLDHPLEDSGVQDGDRLTAFAKQANIAATSWAFALWCGDGMVTWGAPDRGGDSSRAAQECAPGPHVKSLLPF